MDANLTPEERQKIYQEEKARAEAKDKLAAEKKELAAKKEKKKNKEAAFGCLVVLGVAVLFALVLAHCPGETEDEGNAISAAIHCKDFVHDRLVSPSTADFPFIRPPTRSLGNNTYVSRSYVDSQNRFGATVRTEYVCTVRFNGGSHASREDWTLIELKMNSR